MGRKKKYKTEKERREAIRRQQREYGRNKQRKRTPAEKEKAAEYARNYYIKNREKLKSASKARYKPKKAKHIQIATVPEARIAATPPEAIEARITALETEIKELKLDFEEVLKDNKKLADLIKWGKK